MSKPRPKHRNSKPLYEPIIYPAPAQPYLARIVAAAVTAAVRAAEEADLPIIA